jgi:cytochrome subunit of sulfide dehydrogenase
MGSPVEVQVVNLWIVLREGTKAAEVPEAGNNAPIRGFDPQDRRPGMRWRSVAATLAACTLAPAQAQQDPNLARNLAATCANCHGTAGRAVGDMRPLAGVSADRILAQLKDYRAGTLPATIMHQIVKGYTDEQLRLIAGWYAAQSPRK